jgi:hypothetical protein
MTSSAPAPEPTSGQTRQRTLKEILEDNITITIVIAAVATGTTVAGVMDFLTTQRENIMTTTYDAQIKGLKQTQNINTAKHAAEIQELNRQITEATEITRSLAGSLDVGKMFLTQNDLQSANHNVTYFPDAHYYAPNNIKELKYARMPVGGLLRELAGPGAVPHNMSEAIAAWSVDVWKGSAMPVSGTSSFREFFPCIAVYKITNDQIVEMGKKMGYFLDQKKLSPKSADVSPNRQLTPKGNDIHAMRMFLHGESVSNSAAFWLIWDLFSLYLDENIDFSILQIQQVGPVLYTKVLKKFHNIKVNNVEYTMYYVIEENFIVARDNGELVFITTFLPTENPAVSNETSAAINEWLSSFRVVGF